MSTGKLQLIPIGGLGEFGMNCMAVRWQNDIFIIDAGLMFPESELLGVDIVVPDITYLIENREHVRGIVLTHGHEDHIGGLPWLLREINVPIYATEFTLAFVEGKLDEHKLLDNAELIEIEPKRKFHIGPFTIEPIRVTHSLVDCVALAIDTPVGVVIHTGDFKIDLSPPDGKSFDLQTFAEYGKRGVLMLLQDSTNVDRPGYTPSEWAVRPRLDEIFSRTKKKLFFSCFSSSIFRMRIALELAHLHGRKVAIVGRSMLESSEIAQDLGYLNIPGGLIIHPGQVRDFAPEEVCLLISGTQGEPMSALSRAAVDNHKHARIDRGDTVVLSSRVIPGNEKSIYRVIDHLCRREANVIYDDGASGLIHVSGHGSQEELRLMINLIRPKFFVPVHGDFRHLQRHAKLARRRRRAGAGQGLGDQERQGTGGPCAAGRRLLRGRGRRPDHSRSPPPERGWPGDRHHHHQQSDGQGRRHAGSGDQGLRRRRSAAQPAVARDRIADAPRVIVGGEGRSGRDEREDPAGPEALHPEKYGPAARDHAGDSGDLTFPPKPCT
jgi:ribonuclease J